MLEQWALSEVCLGRLTELMELQQERGLGKKIAKLWKSGFNFRHVESVYWRFLSKGKVTDDEMNRIQSRLQVRQMEGVLVGQCFLTFPGNTSQLGVILKMQIPCPIPAPLNQYLQGKKSKKPHL